MKIRVCIIPVLILLNINSADALCKKHFTEYSDSLDKISDIADFISSLIKCEVVKIEKKYKSGNTIWVADILTSGGGSLRIEVNSDKKDILYISASEGPFDYNIVPDDNSVSFDEARITAEKQYSRKILKWAFKKNKGKYEYNFWIFTKTGKAQLRIDAESGETIVKTGKINKHKKNQNE